MLCDVIGCEASASNSFLETELHRSAQFHVCLRHFTWLVQGHQPAVVANRLDLAQLDRRPGILLSPSGQ